MKKFLYILFTGWLTLATQIQAQTISLEDCLQIAHTKNLTLQNGALQISRAELLQKTAFTLNPTSIALTQDLTDGATPDNSIGISQEFSLPSVYAARSKTLKAQTLVANRQQEVSQLQLDQLVTSAYYNILYAREKYRILQQQDSAYVRFLAITEAKVKAGESGRLERINAEKSTEESRISLVNAQNDILQAQYDLAVLMNCDTLVEPAEPRLIQVTNAQSPSGSSLFALNSSLNDARVSVAEHTLSETRKEALPTLSLEAKYYTLIHGLNPYHIDRLPFEGGNGFVFLGVGVNIPLSFGSHAAKVKAAKRDLEILDNERQQQQQSLQALRNESTLACKKAQQTIDYFTAGGLQHADELIRIAQISYEEGEINYIELLENIQTASDLRLQYIDAVNSYNQAMIQLNSLY